MPHTARWLALTGLLISGASLACPNTDFGDAPSSYPVTLGEDGARHTSGTSDPAFRLGTLFDCEDPPTRNATATGDDLTGVDDEDGVQLLGGTLDPGTNATFRINVGGRAGAVDAWCDFNDDGDWADPNEQIMSAQAVVVGDNDIIVAVPGSTVPNDTIFCRFRLSVAGGLLVTGINDVTGEGGEVEDYGFSSVPVELTNFSVE